MTRWVVLHEHRVAGADLDADGTVTDEAVGRWATAARDAYLDRCVVLRRVAGEPGLAVAARSAGPTQGALAGRPTDVVATATATEVRPASFTISVRMRAVGGAESFPLGIRYRIVLEDAATGEVRELGTEIRDELIAMEHSATHFN
ncbi:MAG TPA: hypothetical protein VK453_14055 [Micromonosporaceae bacterium]|nr:hypothetical protein [Micromonosporaceae bacterium]